MSTSQFIDAGGPVDLQYINTFTTTTIDTGDPAVDRYVFLIYISGATDESTSLTMLSATIGGEPATIHAQQDQGIITSRINVAILSALLPDGMTAVVVPTYNRSGAVVIDASSYRVTGLRDNVALDSGSTAFSDTGSSWSRNIDVEAGGFVLAGIWVRHSGGQITSSDMTRDNRSAFGDVTRNAFSSEEANTVADKSFSWANSNGSGSGPFVYASFR